MTPDQLRKLHADATPVLGYDGLYEVDANGDVWSVGHNWRGLGRRQLRAFPDQYGYLTVRLTGTTGRHKVKVHRIVCLAFHGLPPTWKYEVRHLNGDKLDNRPSNLAWGTQLDNAADRERHGRTARGATCRNQHKGKTVCKRGHPLVEGNILLSPIGRACKTCKRQTDRARYYRLAGKPEAALAALEAV